MTTITTSLSDFSIRSAVSNAPSLVSQGSPGDLSVIDSVASAPVMSLLTPAQRRMAETERLIGVYLQIFIASRTAARSHNMFLRASVARMVELEAEKMMSAALLQLVGGVVQGAAGVVSGAMQIGGAVATLKSLRDGMKSVAPQMKAESAALADLDQAKANFAKADSAMNGAQKRLDAAQASYAKLKTEPQALAKLNQAKADYEASCATTESAKGSLNEAQASYDKAKAELSQAWTELRKSAGFKELYKSIDARVAYWNGVGSAVKGGGEMAESGFKYGAAGEDKAKTLLDALKQYLQSSQQSNQDFERDLAEMNRQLLDQLKTTTDRSQQLNMSLGQAV